MCSSTSFFVHTHKAMELFFIVNLVDVERSDNSHMVDTHFKIAHIKVRVSFLIICDLLEDINFCGSKIVIV
jgi:hypothetical protein